MGRSVTQPNHRTALFVDTSRSASYDVEFRERVERLVESLNQDGDRPHGTIKVDVYSLSDHIESGVRWNSGTGFDVKLAVDFASANRYVMVLFATQSIIPVTVTESRS